MAYPLEKLLEVRCHRENRASIQLVQCREALCRAELHKRRKERELSDYRSWRQGEEQRLFENLKSGPAAPQDVIAYRGVVDTLREVEAAKAKDVEESALQVLKAEEELESASRRYKELCRKKLKIEEHKAVWELEQTQLQERAAENELEEHAKSRPMLP